MEEKRGVSGYLTKEARESVEASVGEQEKIEAVDNEKQDPIARSGACCIVT